MRKFRVREAAIAVLAVSAMPVMAQTAANGDDLANKQITNFFETMKRGDSGGAVAAILKSSPLWAERTGTKEQMVAQIQAAEKIYGPVISYDCLPATRSGKLMGRQFCFVQHKLIVTRWQFDVAKLPDGWSIAYFGFNDQAQNWPDGK